MNRTMQAGGGILPRLIPLCLRSTHRNSFMSRVGCPFVCGAQGAWGRGVEMGGVGVGGVRGGAWTGQ
jgi:hypothetical protein